MANQLKRALEQSSASLQQQIDALERRLPGQDSHHSAASRSRSRSPRGQDPARSTDVKAADPPNGDSLADGGAMQLWKRQQAAMAGMNPSMTQQLLARQQQFMMMQVNAMQQLMAGQQQQLMMGNMMGMMYGCDANSMSMMNMAPSLGRNPDETQRMMWHQAQAMQRRQARDERDSEIPPGPSSVVQHPNYRPPDMEPMFGVTDRRFNGHIKQWFDDKGYGFIECRELRQMFPDGDVFLHQHQKRHFVMADFVSFAVFLNFKRRPQGTELRRATMASEEANEA